MLEYIKTNIGENEYAIKKSGEFVAEIWNDCGTRFVAFRPTEVVLNSDDLRMIADMLDELNYIPDPELDSWSPSV